MKKLLLKLVCILLVGIFYPSTVFAFVDEFDSQSSLDNYIVSTNSGAVEINSGKMILSAPNSSKQYPYVLLKSHYFSGEINTISIDFRYLSLGLFGAGIVIDDNYPINGSNYNVGSNSIAWTWNWGSPPKLRVGRFPFTYSDIPGQNLSHNLKITGVPGQYEIYLDDVYQGLTNSTKQLASLWFGNPDLVDTTSSWPVIEIERIEISSPSQPPLPYFSQKDPAWKDLPYDSASVWAGGETASIERWGCAITSVAMVLKEYGIKMPNGEEANPDKLNTWLSAQPDGYIGNGLLNWLAISRLARDARENGQAETDLEFVKSYGSPSDELTSGLYPIIDEGGHFVTLYDQNVDSYLLNDPNDATRSSRPKSEWIKSVNTYTPSDTDLSYILLVIEEGASLVAKYLDNNVGETYLEEISDDVGDHGSGKYNVVYIAKPSSGDYKLNINNAGPTSSLLKIYSYDTNGKVDMLEQSVSTGSSDWMFSYHSDGTDPQIVELDTTAPTYIGTNSFSGWYNTPQTAVFNFVDPNLPSDYVSPTCQIGTEGKNKTCSVSPTVCDKYNNCETFNLTSNPANIDLTPPSPIKHVWGMGMRPFSIVGWSPSRGAVKYIVEWGVDKNSLTNRVYSRDSWAWLPTPKVKQIYIRVVAEDRAGNLSTPSKLEKLNVHPHYWRW